MPNSLIPDGGLQVTPNESCGAKKQKRSILEQSASSSCTQKQVSTIIQEGSTSNSTAVLPRQQLGIGAEMRVKIITRDSSGKELDNGGSAVRAVLSCNEEECRVIPVTKMVRTLLLLYLNN